MTKVLKFKIILGVFSLLLLAGLSYLKTPNGNSSGKTKYKQLTIEDFHGKPKPFSHWGGQISSDIIHEYDSSLKRYHAYAEMDSERSWIISNAPESLLEHEQYHFNLTHYFALKLEKEIIEDSLKWPEVLNRSNELRNELQKAQERYDNEANHGQRRDMQGYWEFKVDSLHLSLSQSSKKLDLHAGVSFINLPGFSTEKEFDNTALINHRLKDYGFGAVMTTMTLDNSLNEENLAVTVESYYENKKISPLENESFSNKEISRKVSYIDSLNNNLVIEVWFSDINIHVIRTELDMESDYDGYKRIFNSIAKSIETVKTDSIWRTIGNVQSYKSQPILDYEEGDSDCVVISEKEAAGFYNRVIINKKGDLLMPYTPVNYPDSLIDEVIVLYNDNLYLFENNDSTLIKIPRADLVQKTDMFIGFVLNNDTINQCQTFINEQIALNLN